MILWLAHIVLLGIVVLFFYEKNAQIFSKKIYYSGLIFKLSTGIILGLIYKYYYVGGDTFLFFESAKKLSNLPLSEQVSILFSNHQLNEWEGQPRIQFFVKFLSFFTRLTNADYWLTTFYLSTISFLAVWNLITQLSIIYHNLRPLILVSFLFVPSVVFWTSGITKDALAYAALCPIIMTSLKSYKGSKISISECFFVILSLFILVRVKHYLMISILIFVGILFVFRGFRGFNKKMSWLITPIMFCGIVLLSQNIHPYLNYNRLALTLYENNSQIIRKTDPSDQIGLEMNEPTFKEVTRLIPKSLIVGLFKPNLFDTTVHFGWIHQIENFLILVLTTFSIILIPHQKNYFDWPVAVATSATILVLGSLLPITSPNYGSLVRYKTPFIPFLIVLISILPYRYLIELWRKSTSKIL